MFFSKDEMVTKVQYGIVCACPYSSNIGSVFLCDLSEITYNMVDFSVNGCTDDSGSTRPWVKSVWVKSVGSTRPV